MGFNQYNNLENHLSWVMVSNFYASEPSGSEEEDFSIFS